MIVGPQHKKPQLLLYYVGVSIITHRLNVHRQWPATSYTSFLLEHYFVIFSKIGSQCLYLLRVRFAVLSRRHGGGGVGIFLNV